MSEQRIRLSRTAILRLAAESARHPDTVARVLEGAGSPLSRDAIVAAAARLNMALPPLPDFEGAPATRFRAT